jgi:hypothetical protein
MQIYGHVQHPCTKLHPTGRAPKPPKVNDGAMQIRGAAGTGDATGMAGA